MHPHVSPLPVCYTSRRGVYTPPARYTHATRTLHARYTLVVQVATKGLSFKHVELDGSQSFILLDS